MSVDNREYALLGGGGLAIEIAEYMLTEGYSLRGYYDPYEDADFSAILPYLGDERHEFSRTFCYIIGAGLIQLRSKMISFIETNDLEAGTFISRHAYISSLAKIGKGSVICPQVVVSGNPSIGNYVLMNIFSNISHHGNIGNNVVVGPGARVNGHCTLGNNVSLGANSALIPGTTIGNNIEIGITTFPRKTVRDDVLIVSKHGRELPNFKSLWGNN